MKKVQDKKQALNTIDELFSEARLMASRDLSLSDRYVMLARKIAMKKKIRMPSRYKRQICKHCNAFLLPGKTCRVRLAKKNVVYFCQRCKRYTRFGYTKKKNIKTS